MKLTFLGLLPLLLGSAPPSVGGFSVSSRAARTTSSRRSATSSAATTERDRALVERSAKIAERFIERNGRKKQSRSGGVGGGGGGGGGGGTTPPPPPLKGKRFRFAATVASSTTVREAVLDGDGVSSAPQTMTLDEYMGLPLDEYILLDDRVVSRTDSGFRFSLPFGALEVSPGKKLFAGALEDADALRAECDLTVESNVRERRNTITGSNFKIIVEEEVLEAARAQRDDDVKRLKRISDIMKPVMPPQPGARPETPPPSANEEGESLLQKDPAREAATTEEKGTLPTDSVTGAAPPSEINETVTSGDVDEDEDETEEERRRRLFLKKREEAMERMKSIESKLGSLSSEERAELDGTASRKIIRGLAGAAPEADGSVVLRWGRAAESDGGAGMGRLASAFSGGGGGGDAASSGTRRLDAKLTLNAELTLAVPVPRFILNPLGSLVLRLAFGQVLPRVLNIVARDYERRASGRDGKATELVDGGILGGSGGGGGGEPTELVDGGILGSNSGGAAAEGGVDNWRGM